nr:hypothetical protein [Lachnospiraceae bacterium]
MELFGYTGDNECVYEHILENKNGMRVHAIDYGCAIKNIFIKDYKGIERDIVLGFDDIDGYEKDHSCLGECLGRHAGRIREGKLVIGDKKYNLNCNIFDDHL